jgi:predicted nucleic acid-binding protein
MILLDAYALVAFLAGGPATAQVRGILRTGDSGVSTLNLAEALDVSQRTFGLPVERTMGILDALFDATLRTIPVDLPIAWRAAALRATYYHRSSRPISLADAVLLASASPGDRIATPDPDIKAVAEALDIEIEPLPGED